MLDLFETYLLKEKRYSEHTLKAYMSDITSFIEFAQIKDKKEDLKEVNKQLIRAWIVQLVNDKINPQSINRKLSSLRTFFKWMQTNGDIEANPTSSINGPKVHKRLPEFVQEQNVEETTITPIFTNDFFGIRDRLMFELFYQTGIRLSELINLKEKDISSNETIKVLGKRNKERIIAISPALHSQINSYLTAKTALGFSNPELFVTDKGVILYPKFVYRKINIYLSKVSSLKKKSPHILRHTFATHLLNNGAGLEVLKEILGHESLAATQIYTHNSFAQINEIYKQAHPRERLKKK